MRNGLSSCYFLCWEDKFVVKVDQHSASHGPGQGGLCSLLPAVFPHKVSGAWWSWPRRMEGGGGSFPSLQDFDRQLPQYLVVPAGVAALGQAGFASLSMCLNVAAVWQRAHVGSSPNH